MTCLVTGLASWLSFGWTGALERAEMRGSLNLHTQQIGQIADAVEKLTLAQERFLTDLTRLTAEFSALGRRLDDYLKARGDGK